MRHRGYLGEQNEVDYSQYGVQIRCEKIRVIYNKTIRPWRYHVVTS